MSTPEQAQDVLQREQSIRRDEQAARSFVFGLYVHYKGGVYLARELVRREDDGRLLVVYTGISDSPYNNATCQSFVRPLQEFLGNTEKDGPRFALLRPLESFGP
jgi:hypothetical protein